MSFHETHQQMLDELIALGGTWTYVRFDSARWFLNESPVGAGREYHAAHPVVPLSPLSIWIPAGDWTFGQPNEAYRSLAERERVAAHDDATKSLSWFISQIKHWQQIRVK